MTTIPQDLLPVLRASWSRETSGQWLPENPARGQCNVTALVVNDLMGGEILKTEAPGGWHFYNRVGDVRYDFTESQFDRPIHDADLASERREALAGTAPERYAALKARVEKSLDRA
jgi:hypothetical protein